MMVRARAAWMVCAGMMVAMVGCQGAFDEGDAGADAVEIDSELTTLQRAWATGSFDGDLGVRASWTGGADLDLFVRTPAGDVYSYQRTWGGDGGRFTKNTCLATACRSQTSEEVSWLNDAPTGTYQIWVARYDARAFADLAIEISRAGAIEHSFLIEAIDGARGARSQVFDVEIDALAEEPPEASGEAMNEPEDARFVGGACAVAGQAGTCQRTWECGAPNVSTPGHCPGPSHIQCCTPPAMTPDPAAGGEAGGVCDPDAAPQPNASLEEEPGDAGCLTGMARVGAFCVDRHEAALVEVLPDGSERGWSPYRNPAGASVRAVSVAGAVPQGYINADQAAAACAASGKRLCSNTEWLRACQGAERRTYPYGQAERPGTCNESRSRHPVIQYFGTSADWIWSELGNACINQLPDSVARTGDHADCVTPEGVFDMMGNLHEWTSDPSGTFRGGFYVDTHRNGSGCHYRTTAHNRRHWDYSTGFRCCADAAR